MDVISFQELKQKVDGYEVMVLLDVRPAEEYQKGHIAGAISLPLGSTMQKEAKVFLKKEDDIIIYANDSAAAEASFRTLKKAYPKLRVFPGGIAEWQANSGRVTDKVSMG